MTLQKVLGFMGRGFLSGGQESVSVFSPVVCKMQASKQKKNSSYMPRTVRLYTHEKCFSLLCVNL